MTAVGIEREPEAIAHVGAFGKLAYQGFPETLGLPNVSNAVLLARRAVHVREVSESGGLVLSVVDDARVFSDQALADFRASSSGSTASRFRFRPESMMPRLSKLFASAAA